MHILHLTQLSTEPACSLHLNAFIVFLRYFLKKIEGGGFFFSAIESTHFKMLCRHCLLLKFSSCCFFPDYYLLATWVEQQSIPMMSLRR